MVLKWLFLKNTQSSPSWTAEVNSHSPWYVNCVAVLFRNCSATNPTKAKHTVMRVYYTLANTTPGNNSSIFPTFPLHPHIATSLREHIKRGDNKFPSSKPTALQTNIPMFRNAISTSKISLIFPCCNGVYN